MSHDPDSWDEFDSFARTILGEDTRLSDLSPTFSTPGETRPPRHPSPRPAREVVMPSGDLTGVTIAGRYVLGPQIGKGGMGRIHKAKDGHRDVAVKLFRPHPRFLRQQSADRLGLRFLREAVVAAALTSPHTVQILEAGQTGDGVLFYAMEYLEGVSIWQQLQVEGPAEIPAAIHVARQVCHSLQELHERRYVHRDVKPHNVMIVERGGDLDFAVLLDFGLVRKIQGQDDYGALTMPGTAVGTPSFSAPEQLLDGDSIDQRADLYTVGLLLYTMLAGRPPFSGPVAREVMIAQARQRPPALTEVRSDLHVPAALQRVLDRTLAKRRVDRYESAQLLSDALAGCV